MGGSASRTRKITLDNENPTSVIKVSEECVQRLKGHQASTPVSPQSAHAPTAEVPPQMVPAFLYEPSLTSIQLRQANAQALKDNDAYWDKRINCLQQNHEEIKNIMEREYEKAMDEVTGKKGEDNLKKLTSLPCGDNRAAIIACYKQYKNEPMKCAKEVQEFAECVDRSTIMIASK